jgi:uncharacterized short protein YbdD (DUF466 family)
MHEWLDHMKTLHSDEWNRKIHMNTWYCDLDHDNLEQFNDYSGFVSHMKNTTNHPERPPPTDQQIDALSRNKQRRILREEYCCPLCDCVPDCIEPVIRTGKFNFNDVRVELNKHIAGHVKTLAFISIPIPDQKTVSASTSEDENRRRLMGDSSTGSYPSGYDSDIRAIPLSFTEDPQSPDPVDNEDDHSKSTVPRESYVDESFQYLWQIKLTCCRLSKRSTFLPYRDRGESLETILQEAEIEWPPNGNSYFIPNDKIALLENEERVLKELIRIFPKAGKVTLSRYAKVIATEATQIFTILLCSSAGKQREICHFIDEHVTDSSLPLVKIYTAPYAKQTPYNYTLGKNEHGWCQVADHTQCGIRALSTWGVLAIQSLCRDQWKAQSPVFRRVPHAVPDYQFPDAVVLPFTEDEEKETLTSGGYGDVWPIRIHPAHQDILISTSNPVWDP